MLQYYHDYFLNEKNDGWKLISGSVFLNIMIACYEVWVSNKEAEPLESLPKEQKKKFWDISKKYQPDESKQIMSAKGAYALTLLTGKTE